MAHLRKSKSNNLVHHVNLEFTPYVKPNDHVIIALSGGVDSVVLLDVLVSLAGFMQYKLSAVHVDHGISSNAKQWCKFCCCLCHNLAVPINVVHLKISRRSGVSLETAARHARYQVFNRLQADYIVLAQHLNDQAETLMLQLLRGAGVRGLAAMPVIRSQESLAAAKILRPLLGVSRGTIEQHAKENQLDWIIDESNEDINFSRNFLRHKVFPLLEKRFPAYKTTFSRSSLHLAEALNLLDELAILDQNDGVIAGKLQIAYLRNLSLPRAKNLFRYTVAQQGIPLPSTVKLNDILQQLRTSSNDSKLHINFGNYEVRCYQGEVAILSRTYVPDKNLLATWQGEERLILKQLHGLVTFVHKMNSGIDLQKLTGNVVSLRLRTGGEQLRPDCNRPQRKLKSLLQEARIPPWERKMLPLLFSGDFLVWVPGIGIDCAFQITSGRQGLIPGWHPD